MAVNRFSIRAQAVQGSESPGPSETAGPPAVPEPRDSDHPDGAVGARADHIAAIIKTTYDSALGIPGEAAPADGFQTLARLSGHLAAMHRAVYPVASHRLGENQHLLKECRAQARETAWALRLLECRLAGESATAGHELDTVHARLGQRLDAYQSAERRLVAGVKEQLTAREGEQLALRYRAALGRAPTRPHPRGPQAGWPGRIAFRLHAFWDGVLDAIDSRPGAGHPE